MDDEILGVIKTTAANWVPREYMPCCGQLIQISQNQGLYAVIGTAYGGDGVKTFALPDLRPTEVVKTNELDANGNPKTITQKRYWKTGEPISMICVIGMFPMHQ